MAQIVEIKGVGSVEFPDGMSQEEMAAALKKLPTPAATPQPAPQEDLTKPAFVTPKQRATELQARAQRVRAEDEQKLSFDQLYTDPDNLKKIQEYAVLRFGKTGMPEPGETSQHYVDRFARHMRMMQTNEINMVTEQNWLNNAKPEDVYKAGQVYDLFENTKSFMQPGGQNPIKALVDYAGAIVSSPSTLLTLGVSKAAAGPALAKLQQQGLKAAVKSKAGATAIGAPIVAEAATNTLQNTYEQKRELSVADATTKEMRKILPQLDEEDQKKFEPQIQELEKKVEEGVSVGQAAVAGAIAAPLSFATETGPLLAAAKRPTKLLAGGTLKLDDLIAARKKQLNITKTPSNLTGNPDADNMVVTTTNVYDGRDLLDRQGYAASDLAQMQVKNSIDKQVDLIADSIWKQMPETAPKAGEKTFDAVRRTMESFDKLPDNVIKQAMADVGTDLPNFMARLEGAGLDEDALKQFSAMYGVSISDAARSLQSLSVIKRMQNKLREVDPAAAKAVDALFGKKDPTTGALGTLKSWVDLADRNMITAMTANTSTLMRNAFGAGVNSTYVAAEEALESMLLNAGRKLAGKSGAPVTGEIGKGINGVINDTVNTWFYMGQHDLAKDITETALQHHPMLMSKMLTTAEEMKSSDLIAPIRILNTPAMLMDNYIRRAVFASSIENNMRKAGLDMLDVMAQDKNIPIDILRQGVDDALTFTFSKTPTEGLGAGFVKIVEAGRPITTVVFPFARFVANATAWTLKHYNPGITAGIGAKELMQGVSMLRKGDEAGQQLILKGSERIAQQATGMATLLAAYAYRKDNQDTPWNVMKSDDGTTVDIKYLFPLNVPFAIADFAYKSLNGNPEDFKTKDFIEAVTGFKAVGATDETIDRLRDATGALIAGATGEDSDQAAIDRMSRSSADLIGAWLGRGTVPLNQFSDIIAAFDKDEALPRDIYSTKPGEERSWVGQVGANIQKNIPVLKQALPEYQSATRVETPARDTGVLKQMTGLALIPPKNEVEAEIEKRSLPYTAVFKTSGDKSVDVAARKFMAENIDAFIGNYIKSDIYQNASDEGKAVGLTNQLSQLQTKAKQLATAQSIQDYYNLKKVPPIEQKTFEAQPPKIRELVIDMYKKQTGKDFYSDDDFRKYGVANKLSGVLKRNPEAVQKEAPTGFDVGGLAAKKVIKEAAGTSLLKQSNNLVSEMEAALAKKTTSPVMDQMSSILQGKPTPKPAVAAKKAAVAPQIEEPIPTPTLKEEVAPAPSNAFTDDDYKLGEALMRESGYTDEMMQKLKKSDYNSYMNEVHLFTGTAKGIKYKDIPPSPFKKEKVADEITGDIEYDIDGNEISVNGVPVKPSTGASEMIDDTFDDIVVPEVDTTKMVKGAQTGDVEQSVDWIDPEDASMAAQRKYVKQRNAVLSNIKQLRTAEFSKIRKDPTFDTFDDEVLAVLQGDFRKKFDREFDVATDKEAGIAMANRYQKKLDELREMYKDVPPKRLWHGNTAEKIEPIKKKGFADPQTKKNFHQELYVGAPSFTSDLNLNMAADSFGGMTPSNILYAEIPYADYVFTRINMKPEAYDFKDLSTIAQSINGSPTVARAVSLPRASYFEKESMMPEANKLRLKSAAKDVEAAVRSGGINPDLYNETAKTLDKVVKNAIKNNSVADAYVAYGGIRDLMKQIESMSTNVSVKGGRGHQSAAKLNTIAGDNKKMAEYVKIADILDQSGAKQKAETLRSFIKSLTDYGSSYGGEAIEEVTRIPQLKSVFKSSEKLAKGGFVAKRR